MSQKTLFLIDGHALLFQAYYAIPQLSTPKGDPVNAVYGFTSMLRKLIKTQNPDYLAITFDTRAPTFRHEYFKDYKANRKPMPDDLRPQFPLLEKVIKAYDIPIYSRDGFEADDIMGTISKKLSKESIKTVIISRDKDLEQLLDDNITILDVKNNTFYDTEAFKAKRGIEPLQMIEMLALVGDSSDNIPGVPGIGPKTATKLINEWDTVDGVLENIDKISAKKTKQSLMEYGEQAKLSRYLATINLEVPIDFDLEDCRVNENYEKDTQTIFKEFGFKTFL